MTLVFESGLILFSLVMISSLLFEMSDSIPWDVSSYLQFYLSGTTILSVVTILFIELFLASSHELAVFHVLSQFFQYYTNRYKCWNARDRQFSPWLHNEQVIPMNTDYTWARNKNPMCSMYLVPCTTSNGLIESGSLHACYPVLQFVAFSFHSGSSLAFFGTNLFRSTSVSLNRHPSGFLYQWDCQCTIGL